MEIEQHNKDMSNSPLGQITNQIVFRQPGMQNSTINTYKTVHGETKEFSYTGRQIGFR